MTKSRTESLFAVAKRPFLNLSPQQKFLFSLRSGFSILTIALIIVLAVFQKYPVLDHVVLVGCGHVSVANGLYKMLQEELSDSSSADWAGSNIDMPIAKGLSDSSILMLSDLTQGLVTDAPQSILLAFTQWCAVRFKTNFDQEDYVATNKTISCQPYTTFNFFNYRQMMGENNLYVVLAYSNQNVTDPSYVKLTNTRQRRFNSMRVLFYTQALSQGALLVSCFLVYGNRGSAKDLSGFRRTTLHLVALVAAQAAISIIIVASVVTHDLTSMRAEVSRNFGDYGINMSIGTLFKILFWMTFSFSIVSSFSWIFPVWCSNPPKKEPEIVFSNRTRTEYTGNPRRKNTYTIKPYRPRSTTVSLTPSSRLFDDEYTKDEALSSLESRRDQEHRSDHVPLRKDYSGGWEGDKNETSLWQADDDTTEFEDNSIMYDPLALSSKPTSRKLNKAQSERELRRLGRKMTMNASTRTRRTKTQELDAIYAVAKEDTHDLLYGENPFASHQYPHGLGRDPADGVSRGASLNSTKRVNSARTRQLLEVDKPPYSASQKNPASDLASLLNEDEAEYLDNTIFVNRI